MLRAAARVPFATALAPLLCSLLGAASAQPQEAPLRIGVVDLEYIVQQSPQGKGLQAKLEALRRDGRAELQARTEAAEEIENRISAGSSSLSEPKLVELKRQREEAMAAIKIYQDEQQRAMQKAQAEGLREIEQRLEPIFQQVQEEGGYDLILNNVPGVVVMAGERVRIDQRVIERLNAAR